MSRLIRKISVGPDYKDSMKYSVGTEVRRRTLRIVEIRDLSNSEFDIYVENEQNECFIWKRVSGMPVMVEYNVDFECDQ